MKEHNLSIIWLTSGTVLLSLYEMSQCAANPPIDTAIEQAFAVSRSCDSNDDRGFNKHRPVVAILTQLELEQLKT